MGKFLLLIVVFFISSAPIYAEEFNVKGYELNISASRRGNNVEVSGRLYGGHYCKNLKLEIFCHNEFGNIAHVTIVLDNAGGSGSKLIEGSDQLIIGQGSDWKVSSVFINCISDGGY